MPEKLSYFGTFSFIAGFLSAKAAVLLNVLIKVAAAASAFLVQIALVRLVGPEGYGKYALFVAYCSLALILGKYGLDVISIRLVAVFFAKRRLQVVRRLGWNLLIAGTFSSLLAGLIFGGLAYMRPLYKGEGVITPILIVLTIIVMCVSAISNGLVKGLSEVNLAEGVDSLGKPALIAIFTAIFAVLPWIAIGLAPQFAFLFANLIIAAVLLYYFILRTRQGPETDEKEELKSLLNRREGFIFVANGLISYGFFQLDTLLLGFFQGEASVGAYAMACNLVRLVIFLAMILVAQSQAKLAVAYHEGDTALFLKLASQTTRYSVIAGAIAAAVLTAISIILLEKISPTFVGAVPALIVLSGAHIANCAMISLSSALNMAGKHGMIFKAQIGGIAITLPLYALLIPPYGMMGAAISVFLGVLVSASLTYMFFRQIVRMK